MGPGVTQTDPLLPRGSASQHRRLLLVTADGALGGGSLLVLQAARRLCASWDVHLATEDGTWLAAEARAAGVTVHGYPAFGPRLDPRPVLAVRRLVRQLRPAVVHAHGTRAMLHTAGLGAAQRRRSTHHGGPVVVHTVHGIHVLHLEGTARALGLQAIRMVSPVADCTTFVSTAERALAVEHALLRAGGAVRVILNGTEDRSYAPQPEVGHVVFVGRMVQQKDPLLAARAAVELSRRGMRVTMVGDGPLLEGVRSIVGDSPDAGRITLTGSLSAADTERIVATADVSLITSGWEGLPLVALEAFRYGIPVVAVDADGVREIVTPAAGGTCVAAHDLDALVQAVVDVVADRSSRNTRSSLARRTWEANHRLEDCLDAYGALYEELLGSAEPAPASVAPGGTTAPGRGLSHREARPTAAECSVVIVNFNGGELVVRAARSAIEAAAAIGTTAEVIVVDNDSHDASPEALEGLLGVTVIRSGHNAGFPAACNTGIEHAGGSTVLLLNPDARLTAEGLATGLAVLRSLPRVGVVGLAQTDAEGHPLPVTYRDPSVRSYLRRQLLGRFRSDAERPRTDPIGAVLGHRVVAVDGYLSGACIFVRHDEAVAMGGLDAELFWAEDADLCRRVRDNGQVVALVPDVAIVHEASTTRNRFLDLALFQQYRGYLRYVYEHDGRRRSFLLAAVMGTEIAVKAALVARNTDPSAPMRRRAYRAVAPALLGWASGSVAPQRLLPAALPAADDTIPRCPSCGGSSAMLHRDVTDLVSGVPGQWSYARCSSPSCGTVHPWPRPEPVDVPAFYVRYHTHEAAAPSDGRRSPAVRAVRAVERTLLRGVVDPRESASRAAFYLDDVDPGSLLEIGCGNGRNLLALRKAGWTVHGQEIDRDAADAARRAGIDVDSAPADACWIGRRFDAVLLIHVAEHVLDLDGTLRAALDRLAPGGRLVVVTPNAASLGHRLLGDRWRGLEAPRHLQILTPDALRAALVRTGFAVDRCDASTAESLDILRASAALALPLRPTPVRSVVARALAIVVLLSRPGAARRDGEVCVGIAHRPAMSDHT